MCQVQVQVPSQKLDSSPTRVQAMDSSTLAISIVELGRAKSYKVKHNAGVE